MVKTELKKMFYETTSHVMLSCSSNMYSFKTEKKKNTSFFISYMFLQSIPICLQCKVLVIVSVIIQFLECLLTVSFVSTKDTLINSRLTACDEPVYQTNVSDSWKNVALCQVQ